MLLLFQVIGTVIGNTGLPSSGEVSPPFMWSRVSGEPIRALRPLLGDRTVLSASDGAEWVV